MMMIFTHAHVPDDVPWFAIQTRTKRRVVHVKRCVVEFFYLVVELSPLVRCQLTALDFSPGDFADVHNQTVYQLRCSFSENKATGAAVHRHILAMESTKAVLPMAGRASNDNQVGVLPAGGHLVSWWNPLKVHSNRRYVPPPSEAFHRPPGWPD